MIKPYELGNNINLKALEEYFELSGFKNLSMNKTVIGAPALSFLHQYFFRFVLGELQAKQD